MRSLAALLLGAAAWLTLPGATGIAIAQSQSQPAREAPAPAASLLPTQAERERFHALAEELRCLVCQNQTLADSDASLAADLRREVEELMLAGRSDKEIKAYLVQRYGDFVLYRPPLQRNTWMLWLGPFALLVVGGFVWWRVQRSHRAQGTATNAESATGASPAGSHPQPDGRGTPSPGAQNVSSADLEHARRLLD
ncbi:MAG: cytochrome c-type biogenesis protein [Burkholderiaceae bacterium]|nr:cytochrome c-type biogenesis protein [Burkholderiaceae bacterium]